MVQGNEENVFTINFELVGKGKRALGEPLPDIVTRPAP